MKKTKIVCTIGPKSESKKFLYEMLIKGMNIMRLNFSHGNYEEHNRRIKNLRYLLKKHKMYAAIILDTKGPEIRTLKLKEAQPIYLNVGQVFTFTTDNTIIGNKNIVAVTYKNFCNDLNIGDNILVDDGSINMKVIKIIENRVECIVNNCGFLGENKGINIPGVYINLPILSKKDKLDLLFACKNQVDFIAASFVRRKSDILKIRKYLDKNGGKYIQIISKIETKESLNNFDEILDVSDGIMVARGDLGVEIPIEEVILAQKNIIKKCNLFYKPVITATQMLDSMTKNPIPTRAEAGDVANAIIDGTDAVMLSAESANGLYPIETLSIMSKICKFTDNILDKKKININQNNKIEIHKAICKGITKITKYIKISLIIIMTEKNELVRFIRGYNLKSNILVLAKNKIMLNQLLLVKGVYCKLIKKNISNENFYEISKSIALKNNLVKKGDLIILIPEKLKLNTSINTISINIV